MDNITFKDNFLYNNNNIIIKFKTNIEEIVIFSDLIIILLDSMGSYYNNENVFCVNVLGQIIWQVPKYNYSYNDSPFVAINKVDETRYQIILKQIERIKTFDTKFSLELTKDISKLAWLHNWDSSYLIIEVLSGKVLIDPDRSMYGKRPW